MAGRLDRTRFLSSPCLSELSCLLSHQEKGGCWGTLDRQGVADEYDCINSTRVLRSLLSASVASLFIWRARHTYLAFFIELVCARLSISWLGCTPPSCAVSSCFCATITITYPYTCLHFLSLTSPPACTFWAYQEERLSISSSFHFWTFLPAHIKLPFLPLLLCPCACAGTFSLAHPLSLTQLTCLGFSHRLSSSLKHFCMSLSFYPFIVNLLHVSFCLSSPQKEHLLLSLHSFSLHFAFLALPVSPTQALTFTFCNSVN